MQSKRYQIFLSSTFADLVDERRKVMQSLLEMDCIPSGMEFFPASNDETFEFIKTVIDESDYYIIIVSARYGSVADDGLSYTEKEYDYAVSSGIPVLGFIRNDISDISLSKTDRDEVLSNKLQAFRSKILSSGRLCKLWSNPDELAGQVISTLNQAIRRHPRPGWIRGDKAASAELLASIHELRTENDLLKSNTISNPPILSIENLAGLDDTITIDVLAKYEGSSRTVKTKISIKFRDLLGAIGHRYRTPHTINSNNDLKSFINQFMDTEYVEFDYIWVRKIITQLEIIGVLRPSAEEGSLTYVLTDQGLAAYLEAIALTK